MEMKKYATIKYLLNEKGRKDRILKGGNGRKLQSLNVLINEQIIKLANVGEDGEVEVKIGFSKINYGRQKDEFEKTLVDYETYQYYEKEKYIKEIQGIIEFDKVMNSEELIEFELKRIENLKCKKERVLMEIEEYNKSTEQERIENKRRKEEEYDKCRREREEKLRKESEEREERARIAREKYEAEIQEWKKERDLWINENGSNYLKDAIELGYNMDNVYIKERVNKELPEFEIDFDDYLSYEEIEEPSEEAIQEVKEYIEAGYKAKIVNITCTTNNEYCEEEGIVICDYLGKHSIARII